MTVQFGDEVTSKVKDSEDANTSHVKQTPMIPARARQSTEGRAVLR